MPRVASVGVAVLLCAAGGAGCQTSLPTAPSDLAAGIVIYEHANYQGASAHVTSDIADLRDVKGPCKHDESDETNGRYVYDWNDCISSVRVAPGWRATLYRDDGYHDDSLEIAADVPNLQLVLHDCPHDGLNDCVTSIRVRPQ
jgi:Peptidase inhibitor family I36